MAGNAEREAVVVAHAHRCGQNLKRRDVGRRTNRDGLSICEAGHHRRGRRGRDRIPTKRAQEHAPGLRHEERRVLVRGLGIDFNHPRVATYRERGWIEAKGDEMRSRVDVRKSETPARRALSEQPQRIASAPK